MNTPRWFELEMKQIEEDFEDGILNEYQYKRAVEALEDELYESEGYGEDDWY